RQAATDDGSGLIVASHAQLGERFLSCEGAPELLFTENETNTERLVRVPNRTPYVKDGFNSYLVHGRRHAVNAEGKGTKAGAHYSVGVPGKESRVVRLGLAEVMPDRSTARGPFGSGFDDAMAARRREADEFYAAVIPSTLDADAANVMRQALAGMLWSKQFY